MKILKALFLMLLLVSCGNPKKVTKSPDEIVAPFDGQKFNNIEPTIEPSLFDVFVWQVSSIFTRKSWPSKVAQNFFKPETERTSGLKVSVINHATVLIQINGVNVLTDPQFSKRASPLSWAGPKRVIQPGIALKDLPPIDAVVISHDHYDHLDIPSLKKIAELWNPIIYAGLGNKPLLRKNGLENVIEMDWWQKLNLKNIQIQFVPVQHWSARGPWDRRETLWGGYVIHGDKKVFFAGDTGYGKVFKMIKERVGPMDLSLIPIGAYMPRDFMKNAHVWPKESVKIFQDTESENAVGIHFGTFADLTNEYIDEPPKDLKEALIEQNISTDRFIVPEFGKAYTY
jgi:L-ascorbate metabolism protein UlaG (beta-lactamase superfamily)